MLSTYNSEACIKDFFNNNRLFKIGIKNTDICSMCLIEADSNIHMLLHCQKTKKI